MSCLQILGDYETFWKTFYVFCDNLVKQSSASPKYCSKLCVIVVLACILTDARKIFAAR